MLRVIALNYSSARLMGVHFKPENRGGVYVGVALCSPEQAAKFADRSGFEMEDLEAGEADSFPADFPLLAPQRASLVRAGLDDLNKLAAHDFAADGGKVKGISERSVTTIEEYLVDKGLRPKPADPPATDAPAPPPGGE